MIETKNSLTYYVVIAMLCLVPIVYWKEYLGPIPISIEIILIPLLVLAALYDYWKKNIELNSFPVMPILIAFISFFIASLLSLIKAEYMAPAIMEILRFLSYVFLFTILVKIKFSKEQYFTFAKVFGATALLIGIFGIIQYVFDISLNKAGLYALEEAKGRVDGTLENPNYFSSFLNYVIPTLVLLSVVYFQQKKWQFFYFGFFAIYVINLIFTYTRAAWVTMFCAFFLTILFMPKRFLKGFFKPHMLIAFVVLIVSVYFMPDVQSRTNSAIYAVQQLIFPKWHMALPGDGGDGEEDPDVVEEDPDDETTERAVVSRVTLWKTGWFMFRDNPLLGVGIGNYYDRYSDFTEKYPELDIGHETYSVHNSYLKVMAEGGTIGILTFMSIYVIFFLYILRLFFKQPDLKGKVIAAGLFVGSTTFMVQNLSNNLMFIPRLNVIFWLVGALALAFLYLNQKQFKDA
ncbi:O-antigen ligase [Bacillus oleivorans]|uniref:O-antigen ligase n=1 Tax=Bacillus oleivorans TaxID=1448271 RepID=A0A285CIB4_9BACI|nr:O-antigen ligase family protein [Bacillus oleivorans]SNX67347.1 O-antigen ligase [Bacillus oleivorans]